MGDAFFGAVFEEVVVALFAGLGFGLPAAGGAFLVVAFAFPCFAAGVAFFVAGACFAAGALVVFLVVVVVVDFCFAAGFGGVAAAGKESLPS